MNRKPFAYASLLIGVILLLAACAPAAEPTVAPAEPTKAPAEATEAPEPTATTPPAKSKTSNTLVFASDSGPLTFDPLRAELSDVDIVCFLAYDALVQYEPGTAKIVPWLAKEWEISDDGRTYTFKLREGVKFHDGTDLTASDVKFTFDRIMKINDGMAFTIWEIYDSTEAVDDYTFVLKLKEPSARLFATLPKFFILSEDGVKANSTADDPDAQTYLEDHDLGSGPYTITYHVPAQQTVYEKFEDYWGGWEGTNIERVIYREIKESATQRLLLEQGEIDIIMGPSVDDVSALEANPDTQVWVNDVLIQFYIDFRITHPPLDEVCVRKALALAYDYDTHMEVALGGLGEQAQGPYNKSILYHDDTLPMPDYDLEAAKAALAECGYPDPDWTFQMVYLPNAEEQKRAVEIFQASLAELGITIEPVGVEWAAYLALSRDLDAEPDLFARWYFPETRHPDSAVYNIYHSKNIGIGNNSVLYNNPKADELMERGLIEMDPAEAEKIYKELQWVITEDQPSIFVSNPKTVFAGRTWVKGYENNMKGHHMTFWVYGGPMERGNLRLEGKP